MEKKSIFSSSFIDHPPFPPSPYINVVSFDFNFEHWWWGEGRDVICAIFTNSGHYLMSKIVGRLPKKQMYMKCLKVCFFIVVLHNFCFVIICFWNKQTCADLEIYCPNKVYFCNYFTLNRSNLAAWFSPLDPRLL